MSLGITGLAFDLDSRRTDDQAARVVRDARARKVGSAPIQVWHVMGCAISMAALSAGGSEWVVWSSDSQPSIRDAFACRTSPPSGL